MAEEKKYSNQDQCSNAGYKCTSSPCLHRGTCIEEANGFLCNCTWGYEGTWCETGT